MKIPFFGVNFSYLLIILLIGIGCGDSKPKYVGKWIAYEVNNSFGLTKVNEANLRIEIEFFKDNTFKSVLIEENNKKELTGSYTVLDEGRIKLQENNPNKSIQLGEYENNILTIMWDDTTMSYVKEKLSKPIAGDDIDIKKAVYGIDNYKFGDRIYPMCKGYKILSRSGQDVLYKKDNILLSTKNGLLGEYSILFGDKNQDKLIDHIIKNYGPPERGVHLDWTTNDAQINITYYKDRYNNYSLQIRNKIVMKY